MYYSFLCLTLAGNATNDKRRPSTESVFIEKKVIDAWQWHLQVTTDNNTSDENRYELRWNTHIPDIDKLELFVVNSG